MMVGIYFTQIIIAFFIQYQSKQVRNSIYSLIIGLHYPPKRKMNIVNKNNINNDKKRYSD